MKENRTATTWDNYSVQWLVPSEPIWTALWHHKVNEVGEMTKDDEIKNTLRLGKPVRLWLWQSIMFKSKRVIYKEEKKHAKKGWKQWKQTKTDMRRLLPWLKVIQEIDADTAYRNNRVVDLGCDWSDPDPD